MIYIYIYLLLNLFGTIQLGNIVKEHLGSWDGLIEILKYQDRRLEQLTNKQIMTSLSIALFLLGFIMWLYGRGDN